MHLLVAMEKRINIWRKQGTHTTYKLYNLFPLEDSGKFRSFILAYDNRPILTKYPWGLCCIPQRILDCCWTLVPLGKHQQPTINKLGPLLMISLAQAPNERYRWIRPGKVALISTTITWVRFAYPAPSSPYSILLHPD